ncbi:hypothetical protein K7W03_26870 [Sphingobium sp. PNB]|uniref:hypothetical protein n=1 Tax=Sphingobium sp. PNB TaxID=863934 RepID=UPI001CA4053F|nr:hypothetical protein [Sphingobium sp. PNB]MCB4863200.1 hypothetical protein [Sphingobium sp. PNB]
MAELLNSISSFCEAHGLSEWQFGELALNDRHLIRQLRDGRDLRMSTVERLKAFMATYRPTKQADAA